jgi:choline kinase
MGIDYALILSAGYGTRMGEIGKTIPKLLWPIFDMTMLDLQILNLQNLGIKKIYVNVFYLASSLKDVLKKYPDVVCLEEKELLGVGGAVHNLAREVNYRGRLLIVNGDQFLNFEKKELQELASFSDASAVITSINVRAGDGYNGIGIEKKFLKNIEKNNIYQPDQIIPTYSGVSLVELSKINPHPGVSAFFETVADYKNSPVRVVDWGNCEYWDLGTLKRYFENHFKLIQTPEALFYQKLALLKVLDPQKADKKKSSYRTNLPHVINLASTLIDGYKIKNCIVLNSEGIKDGQEYNNGIIYRDVFNAV